MPLVTSVPAIKSCIERYSAKKSQPKKMPKIGVRKAKLATVVAEYLLRSQSQQIKPTDAKNI